MNAALTSLFSSSSRTRRRLRPIAVGVMSVTALALVGCSSAEEPAEAGGEAGTVAITIAAPAAGSAVFPYLAQQLGIFEDNGLDVTVESAQNIALLPAAVAAGQYEFAITVSPIFLNARAQNLPVVASAGGTLDSETNHNVDLIVADDSPIETYEDLEGTTVAAAAIQGNQAYCLQQTLDEEGVGADAATLAAVPFVDMPAQLEAGLVDAALIGPPQSTGLIGNGYRTIGNPCLTLGLPQLGVFLMSNQGWADENADTIEAVQRSITEVGEWTRDEANREELLALVEEYTGLPAAAAGLYQAPELRSTGSVEDLQRWAETLVNLDVLTTEPDLKSAVIGE